MPSHGFCLSPINTQLILEVRASNFVLSELPSPLDWIKLWMRIRTIF